MIGNGLGEWIKQDCRENGRVAIATGTRFWQPGSVAVLALLTASLSGAGMALATAPSIPQPPVTRVTPADAAYTLGAGDRLRIDIFQVPQYSGEQEVLVNGVLNLPLAGQVSVNGLTLEEAAAVIRAAYDPFLRRPRLTVSLLTPRPLQIGIAGEVNRPGSYTVERAGTQFPTLTQLLERAGGITQSADVRQIQIRRSHLSGRTQTLQVDLWQLLQTGDLQYDLTLRDGDTVFVPTLSTVNLAEASQLASASFAANGSQPINIAVVGQVFRPGPYTVTGTARTGEAGVPGGTDNSGRLPTVTRAIQVAGGITPLANIRQVEIRRPTRSGTEQVFQVDLWALLQEGDLRQDAILQEGDTVLIPTATALDPTEASQTAIASFSPDTIQVNVVGEVIRPGVVEVPPGTPLNQALLAAGGFNNRARRGTVQLIRLNLDGSVSRQRLEIDFANAVGEDINPALRNNDVIIVGRSVPATLSDTLDAALSPLGRFLNLFLLPARLIDLF